MELFPWGWTFSPFSVAIATIFAWFILALVKSSHRARLRELEIRERIALIEKGLVPPPEKDPGGFDRAMRTYDRVQAVTAQARASSADRHRRAGVVLIGVGLGLMVLIGFCGSPDEGYGVGGFIAILGLAFVINSLFERQRELDRKPSDPMSKPPAAGPSSPTSGGTSPA